MRSRLWGMLIVAVGVVSCGGGDGPGIDPGAALTSARLAKADPAACGSASADVALVDGECVKVFQAIGPQRSAVPAQRSVPVLTDTALFNWAQGAFPQFFGGSFREGNAGPYHYRYYFGQQAFLAVGNGGVYVLGPLSGNQILFIAMLADFTCTVYSCAGTGGTGSVDWNSAFSASEIIDEGPTLAAGQRQGWTFQVTNGNLPVETIFAAQFRASLYVMPQENLNACVNGGAFNYYGGFSFDGKFGYLPFTLPPGNYGVCLVNDSNASNGTRIELQNQLTVDGFHYVQPSFDPIVTTVANGGRIVQPVTVGDNYRVIVDGGNSGGEFYIIPANEQQNFLADNGFKFYEGMTASCGSTDRAAPGLCELTGVGDYAIAYRNNTGSAQSIVVVGRVFVPD